MIFLSLGDAEMSSTVELTRRSVVLGAFTSSALAGCARAADGVLTIYKTASCTCCEGWVRAMQRAGFTTRVVPIDDVSTMWRRHGVRDELSSCHLSLLGGYVFVGHVPAADIQRFLALRPRALGLTVPGMPIGSPGMEISGAALERFETLMLLPGGATRVFARHGPVVTAPQTTRP